ncbi:MAG: cysteine--tRNA ligase [Candidatus Pacebacteria bacterium]|nr:cysteine--tRNA ligase [Candidatus Paceibacterota bacterium]
MMQNMIQYPNMLKVHNTLSGKKEEFQPRQDKKVNLFVCGPTVYDYSHLGHARTYIIFDVIVKYLKQKGYDVFYLQNITDIDDKIINRAKERKTTPEKLARDFEKEYLKDMKGLKVDSVSKYARATEHIKEIISQVERLLKKGFAYQIEDGIYYDIAKFKEYGKLSKRTALQAEDAVSRIDESKGKRNRGDFCLWKLSKEGEPSWPSPWGKGRPGWHIEDTAITEKYFGSQYDIHGGARDLIFPHHEAEIAQMKAISGKTPLVKYWLHSGFLTVKGQKMAKSLGNFITIRDFLKENSTRVLRLLVAKNHYRSPLDYNDNLVLQTERELERVDEFVDKLSRIKSVKAGSQQILKGAEEEFEKAMEDDFNTPRAVAAIFELISAGNSLIDGNKISGSDAKAILAFLKEIDKVFNFIFWKKEKQEIPEEVIKLVKEREKCRKEGLWQKADEIRKEIKELGYWVEDTKDGSKIKKI